MSLPRLNVLVLSVSMAFAVGMAGCSSNPTKSIKDTGPEKSEQAYYESAQKSLDRGQWTDANKFLQALDTYYPTSAYNEQAQLELMYSKLKQADYPAVIMTAERFMRIYPNSSQLDYAYYIRGIANMEQNYDGLLRYTELNQAHRDIGYLRLAYDNFRDFIQRFPSSRYAVDAAQRMQYINQELAESEMNVARFNLKRQAWLAAIQRARWVLEYYPQTPQTPEALATIAHGYQQLGDQTTAQQYIDIIKLNYPTLLKRNGDIDLNAARGEASLLNRLTLGILGRDANHFDMQTNAQATAEQLSAQADEQAEDTGSKIGKFFSKFKLPSFGGAKTVETAADASAVEAAEDASADVTDNIEQQAQQIQQTPVAINSTAPAMVSDSTTAWTAPHDSVVQPALRVLPPTPRPAKINIGKHTNLSELNQLTVPK